MTKFLKCILFSLWICLAFSRPALSECVPERVEAPPCPPETFSRVDCYQMSDGAYKSFQGCYSVDYPEHGYVRGFGDDEGSKYTRLVLRVGELRVKDNFEREAKGHEIR